MLEIPSKFRERRRKLRLERPLCPICSLKMTKKGKKKDIYFKCKKCGNRKVGETFKPKFSELTKMDFDSQVRAARKEDALAKFVRKLKMQRYLPFKTVEYDGKFIDLAEYGKDGVLVRKKEIGKKEERKEVDKVESV